MALPVRVCFWACPNEFIQAGVPPKGFAQSRTRGRAATGCAALRHFVLAARAATLHIPARQ